MFMSIVYHWFSDMLLRASDVNHATSTKRGLFSRALRRRHNFRCYTYQYRPVLAPELPKPCALRAGWRIVQQLGSLSTDTIPLI